MAISKRKIWIKIYICDKCGHEWMSRYKKEERTPKMCPKCKTKKWNINSN